MATLLLGIIFVLFLGRGMPDSLFGAAWPVIYPEFNLPLSYANYVNILFAGSTIISILLSTRIVKKFGTAKSVTMNLILMAAALLGLSFSKSFWWILLFSFPLGFGIGVVDTSISNYLAVHYKASHISFMQSFYGIGVSISPLIMSFAIARDNNWRLGYRIMFFIILAISVLSVVSLPLWKKAHPETAIEKKEEREEIPGMLKLAVIPGIVLTWLLYLGSNAVELTCSNWGSSFLINSKGFDPDVAAKVVTLHFIGMAVGRFLSGILAMKMSSWKIIKIGFCSVTLAIVLLLLPLPPMVSGIALFCIGLGNGPLIPNMIHLTPKCFGMEISQPVLSSQFAASYVGILLMPTIFGYLADIFSTDIFPLYILAMFAIMFISLPILIKTLKKHGTYKD